MRKVFVFILLLAMSISFATDVPIDISSADITYKMEGTIFVTIGPASSINIIEFNGSVVPQFEGRNDKLYGATLTYDELGNEILTREYQDVEDNINWDYYTEFKTKSNFQKLSNLASFPHEVYPANVEKYLEFSKNSNINEDIRETASSIVQGSETVVEAALKLSEWVHNNIEYDSEFYGRNYDAETVFENKKGVCGEFSSLLVSMLRSVGIPARYVPGYVYSNIPGYDGFGAHAWIEFYDPVNGWIPTDPTFGEFGF
ncbi:transglutaminase-like domain-containing protein, partial [Candidatus Woesearchaeota archaeon]|nr:transglutaminase-like domain-containing protein [Candidatus Woesearchaeota archaeon]